MSDAKEGMKLSLKVITNKERNKVLFAEADNHFVDILLSFLTLPLGRVFKVLDNHRGDNEAVTIGSLSSLYHSVANLDSSLFVTEGAKEALLNPKSSFEDEHKRLKLDIAEFQPYEFFYCPSGCSIFLSESMYYDNAGQCLKCRYGFSSMKKEVVKKVPQAAFEDGVFTMYRSSFVISDDLQIFPNLTGLCQIFSILGIADTDEGEAIEVTIGLNEMLRLLKASLISPTPLSNLILNKASLVLDSEPKASVNQIEIQENPKSKNMVLKVVVRKSSGKFLYAQAEKDFVEFLFGLLFIPVGGVHHLLSGETCIKAIDNLYRSAADLIHDKYFRSPGTKNRLMKPNVVHGCISENYILPLDQECLPDEYTKFCGFSSSMFPKGQGRYLYEATTYMVMDDLTVTPFCVYSVFSSLNEQKIPRSDLKEMEVQVGLKEIVDLLKRSLLSKTPLTDVIVCVINKNTGYVLEDILLDKIELESTSSKRMTGREDFVDFILSFLTIPLGGVVSLFEGQDLFQEH
ncbi:uncharacterized protein LOC131010016 [Salvia miltiorrhiza]|uniref:uncharacterized protein LOC131010016 n=1 Tax=Salvia miltiorrhiza TaxID=226208 RepID=UPI0025AC4424|nr:uncharacterized protein LOC131010016 [Salvia miltiorrhiza]